ncbi:unnamed protein product [Fusarium graminearum]|uniref:Chromosome 1, complete genome n=1 Tax=Gibberella zeae (strain ATCC MYA-4620 / CBS 123657 / FGSC 9075 / NRRL 31084 / PH-1) TaxID=229533 RepID=A0A098D2L9_GIBZE|nr:unnamed protein product [Fusarium graminearum]
MTSIRGFHNLMETPERLRLFDVRGLRTSFEDPEPSVAKENQSQSWRHPILNPQTRPSVSRKCLAMDLGQERFQAWDAFDTKNSGGGTSRTPKLVEAER